MGAHAVLVDTLERELKARGAVPLAWFEVLRLLAEDANGARRMQDVAEHLRLSKSGVTRLVDRMEAAGVIARQSCSQDRRGTYAVLTDAGRETLQRSEPTVLTAVAERFGQHLSKREAELLLSALNKVIEANEAETHALGARG